MSSILYHLEPLTKEIRLKIFDPIISNSFPVRYYGISGTNFPDVPYSVPESRLTYGIPNVLEFGQATILKIVACLAHCPCDWLCFALTTPYPTSLMLDILIETNKQTNKQTKTNKLMPSSARFVISACASYTRRTTGPVTGRDRGLPCVVVYYCYLV